MMLPIRQWFDCEAEKFRAELLACQDPGWFAWTYFLRAAINAEAIVRAMPR